MVTKNNNQLATCILQVAVIKITYPSLALVRYLLQFTPVYSYRIRCSCENLISGNIFVVSYGVFLVAISLLDLLIFSLNSVNSPTVRANPIDRPVEISQFERTNITKVTEFSLNCLD